MRLNRFFLPGAVSGATMALPGDEAGHATRVLRVTAGTSVRVFDGQGHEFAAVVRSVGRSGVDVEVGEGVPAPAAESLARRSRRENGMERMLPRRSYFLNSNFWINS